MISVQILFKALVSLLVFVFFSVQISALTDSEARDQVTRLYQRLAGVPPTAEQISGLIPSMKSGNPAPTAFEAMREDSFYKTTLVRIFSPFGNVEGRIDEGGSDYNSTIVGLVRDNEDFRQAISGDVLYTGDNASMSYEFQVNPPLGNAGDTVDRCPLNIRTRARPQNVADRIASDMTWQRALGDSDYDPRFDPYMISINNGGDRIAIAQRANGVDEFGATRPVPGMAAQSQTTSYPASRFPLFSSRGYGNNDETNPNLTWAVCHRWRDFRDNPPANKIRPLGRENDPTSFAYSFDFSNNQISHYADLVKIPNWPQLLIKRTQSQFYSLLAGQQSGNNGQGSEWNKDVAGVMTTLVGGKAYFSAGTNRRAISLTYMNWLGYSMEQLHDPNVSIQYIRQDLVPEETCAGCHGKMDAAANATNRLDFNDDRLKMLFNFSENLGNKLFRGCMNHNNPATCLRPSGFNPRNLAIADQNRWWNPATTGRNSFLGWRTPQGMNGMTEGVGFNSLMKVFANTEAFSNRMLDLATRSICLRNQTPTEIDETAVKARDFETGISAYASENADNPYNLRAAFAEAAKTCFGRKEN